MDCCLLLQQSVVYLIALGFLLLTFHSYPQRGHQNPSEAFGTLGMGFKRYSNAVFPRFISLMAASSE